MDDPFNKNPAMAKLLGELKSQVMPSDLPDELTPELRERYPLPWRIGDWRGNGHTDIFAANDKYVAHIYCWDENDEQMLVDKVERLNARG